MALGQAWAIALDGVVGVPVQVECDVAEGVPHFALVGLPDTSISEARERVRSALTHSGLPWKPQRVTVNLSPAHVRKQGTGFDLAMAVGLATANGALRPAQVAGTVFVGELGLDGRLHPVRGLLPALLAAAGAGFRRVVVPVGNRAEAGLPLPSRAGEVRVLCAPSLADVLGFLAGADSEVREAVAGDPPPPLPAPDLAEVRGQSLGRRVIEIAAAGGHHAFLSGPPGAGKTMLAERLPGILPPLDDAASVEVTSIHSVAGTLSGAGLIRRAPFESPHHNATAAAIVGGGSGQVRPGAISRAHHGVLFLDEAPEFARTVLDQLRQPLESGRVTVHRAAAVTTYPARFQLVLAANPCPCASPSGDAACVCTSVVRRRYVGRLSGPLLDRVDLTVTLQPAARAELLDHGGTAEPSSVVLARVTAARETARARWGATNAVVPARVLRATWSPQAEARRLLERAYERGLISGRGYERTLRVAWTMADLAGRESPRTEDVAEALGFRTRAGAVAA